MKLTTHFHLVPISRMRVAITSFPQYAFMTWYSVKKYKDIFTFYGGEDSNRGLRGCDAV
jgi:hypothetical protein